MMIMRRREAEKILIGDDVILHTTQGHRIRTRIEAPREEKCGEIADTAAATA